MSGTFPPSYGNKPAASYLDYSYSFVTEIAQNESGDTISSVSIVLSPDDGSLVVSNIFSSNGIVTFWLAGGTRGATYTLTITATMTSGRIIVSDPNPTITII